MDKRSHRNKRGKHHSSRTHERPNQGILGRVASKVKGLLNPWFFSVWNQVPEDEPGCSTDSNEEESTRESEFSHQTTSQSSKRRRLGLPDQSPPEDSNVLHAEPSEESNFAPQTSRGIKRIRLPEHSIPSCSTGVFNETPREQDYFTQNSTHGSKRPRLPEPSILSAGTQTWLDAPDRPNLFGQASHVPSSSAQNLLIENKESSVIMNGDDHSENSEESASTSGCSSLVSHKDRANCISSIILGESEMKDKRDAASQKGGLSGDIGSRRMSLWSRSASPVARCMRPPSAVQSSQPGFSLSAFGGASKLNNPAEKKVSSPFYQGSTTFGGASATRRMPIAAAPYQVEKPLRNQIKFRSNPPNDSYEGMSSAAKRILQTLEKMSSPVTDAKKIPNTNKSPVDLSLYLMPPKHRRNLQSTPVGPTKGPPIADISTISKLTTIKNYGQRRFQNTLLDSPTLFMNETSTAINSVLSSTQVTTVSPSLPSGGGKMRNKLNQQHRPSAKSSFGTKVSEMESRMSEYIDAIGETTDLPDIPLPITSLPTISFGSNSVKSTHESKQISKDFVFSNPIEHVVPNTALSNQHSPLTCSFPTPLPASTEQSKDSSGQTFLFSSPIEHEIPTSAPSLLMSGLSSQETWECGSCWVQNPIKETKCMCCEAPNSAKGKKDESIPQKSSATPKNSFENVEKCKKTSSMWECGSCWIRNPADKVNCLACEAPNPSKANSSVNNQSSASFPSQPLSSSSTVQLTTTGSGFKFSLPSNADSNPGLKFGDTPGSGLNAPSTLSAATTGFKIPTDSPASEGQNVSFGGFKMAVNKQSNVETDGNMSNASASCLQSSPAFSAFAKIPVPQVPSLWECDVCLVKNEISKQKCEACGTLQQNKNLSGFSFKPSNEKNLKSGSTMFNTPTSSSAPGTSTVTSPATVSTFATSSTTVPAASTVTTSTVPVPAASIVTTSVVPASISVTSCLSILISKASDSSKASDTMITSSISSGSVMTSKLAVSSASSPAPTFQFGSCQSSGSSVSTPLSETPKNSFTFGAKDETANKQLSIQTPAKEGTPSQTIFKNPIDNPAFGKPANNQAYEGVSTTSSSLTLSATPPVFQFGSTTTILRSWECLNCQVKNEGSKQKCTSCDASRPDKNASKITTTSKVTENTRFQSSTAVSTHAPVFQFGTQASPSVAPISSDANNARFSFGTKNGTSNPTPVSTSQTKVATFGAPTPSVFGNSTVASSFTSKPTGGFGFGAADSTNVNTTNSAPVFQFNSTAPSNASSWQCSGCLMKNEAEHQKCKGCDTVRAGKSLSDSAKSSNPLAISGFPTAATSAPVFQFGSQPTNTKPSTNNAFGASNAQFSFGVKSEATNQLAGTSQAQTTTFGGTPSQSMFGSNTNVTAFGKPADKPAPGGFNFGATVASSATPVFQFGSTPQSDLWECSSCRVKNDSEKQKCISCDVPRSGVSGFTFKGANEIKPNNSLMSFNAPVTTSVPTSGFTFNSTASASTGGFVFGVKSEPSTATTSVFSFGSGSAVTSKPSITGFETNTSSAPAFQFGNQPSGTSAPSSTFGASSNAFTFGAKTETAIPLQPIPASQTPTPAFGSAPSQNPLFGSTTASPAFGKQAPGGFNFGLPASSNANPVFQFGAPEKKQATNSGFSFGLPTQDAANFQPQFNMATPPTFNFGAASAPGGPFQFAASTDTSQQGLPSAPRKFRKAVRRMK